MVRTWDDHEARVTLLQASAGERTVPGVWHENYWFRRHEVAYELACGVATALLAGLDAADRAPIALDAGCGEGYGAARLAQVLGPTRAGAPRPAGAAGCVLALDYDSAAMRHLAARYPELTALRGNLVGMPLADDTADLVVSLQTIEHLWDPRAFVCECARVLRPGGRVLLSTPNRLTFPPGNVFHHRELDADELLELMGSAFGQIDVSGLHHGRRLRSWEDRHGSIVDAQIATEPDRWPPSLAEMVRSITAADFEIRPDVADSRDLIAQAIAP